MSDNSKKPIKKIQIVAISVCAVGMLMMFLVVAAIFFPEKVQWGNAVIVVGIPFLVMGVGCLTNKTSRLLGIGCTLFGVGMIGFPWLVQRVSNGQDIGLVELVIKLGSLAIVASGPAVVVYSCQLLFNKITRCTLEVEAEFKDIRTECGNGQQMRSYGYEYYYGGQVYTVIDNFHMDTNSGRKQLFGSCVKIKIDPENPEIFYTSQPGAYLILMSFGLAITAVGVFLLLLL